MNFLDKAKEFMKKSDSKKFMKNLVVLLSLGIILLVSAKIFIKDENLMEPLLPNENLEENRTTEDNSHLIEDYAEDIEIKLQKILSQIKGVRKVEVMVTLEDTAERIPVFNTTISQETTSEKDSQGGTRESVKEDQSHQIVTGRNDESLIIIKEVKPKVNGVIVVADGAEDIRVRERLYLAVKTVLGISGNRVEIFSSN